MTKQLTKSWAVAATFDNFADADRRRNELKDKHDLVKVKRGFKVYRVKTWDEVPVKEEKKSKKLKKSKAKRKDI